METITFQDNNQNILIIVIVAALVILFAVIVSLIFRLNIVENLVMSWILTTVYSLFAFFVMDSSITRQTETERVVEKPVEVIREVMVPFETTLIKVVEKPIEVIREVAIQIPIENKTIEVVEKQVIKEVPVYIREKARKKINIPKYAYLASSQTKRYHKRSCRLGKLIKKKFKIQNNSQAFFKKKHFKACKMCIKK